MPAKNKLTDVATKEKGLPIKVKKPEPLGTPIKKLTDQQRFERARMKQGAKKW